MATLTVAAAPARVGINVTNSNQSVGVSGDKFLVPTGDERVCIVNGDSASCTVTLQNNATLDGATVPAITVVVAAGKTVIFGPFPPQYVDTNSFVNLSYSNTTSTIKVLAFHA